ncbi:DUF1007 family protein [Fulvimarina endophytica]|uniref:DUF1007 family protein n=1 Tax=Fulvimarina endophytica TaxID=2293836 RepID=A0A371X856_9HYPH|nr:DUF1007 family protein [Fulvimarina endophytica]RFC65412.1 DUF1007 family protein [Fulvimarina endophytica]
MGVVKRGAGISILAALGLSIAGPALAHPHVFIESHVELVGDETGHLKAIRNVWRMDELFSSSVVVDFDNNANGTLDPAELDAIGETIKTSIAEWGYYTFAELGGRDAKLSDPDRIHTLFEDGQLILFFEMPVAEDVDLRTQPVKVSNFDESFFVAFDFAGVDSFQLVGLPGGCRKALNVPDEDDAAQKWMDQIATLGPDEEVGAEGAAFADVMATRLELTCAAQS